MQRLLILMSLMLACASIASAQTHPCDIPPDGNTTLQTNGPVSVGFCQAPKDADGNTVTLTGFRVTIDGADVFKGPLSPIGAPNATGLSYYETPKTIVLAKGSHTAVAYASSADGESAGTDPFVFTLKGLPPGKGKIQKVLK